MKNSVFTGSSGRRQVDTVTVRKREPHGQATIADSVLLKRAAAETIVRRGPR